MTFEVGDEGGSPGNPAGFIAYHLSIGTSGRGMLSEWRALGGTTGDRAWYSMIGQVQDTINRTDQMAALDPTVLPSSSDYGTWSAGRGDQYATQVNVTYRDRTDGALGYAPYTHITNDPHTPEDAEQAAIDAYTQDDNPDKYDQDITGAFVTHIWRTVPFQ